MSDDTKQLEEFQRLTMPVIEYLNKYHGDRCQIIIDTGKAEVVYAKYAVCTGEPFIKEMEKY